MTSRCWSMSFSLLILEFFLLTVTGICDDSVPVFVSEPPSSLIYSNRNGTIIHCGISVPGAVYEWYSMDELRIYDVPNLRLVLSNGSLVIPPFSSFEYNPSVHSSEYRCRARVDNIALISRLVSLKPVIEEAVQIRVKDVYAYRGNTAVIRCNIPQHTLEYVEQVDWRDRGGRRIPGDGGKYTVLSSGDLLVHQSSSYDEYTQFRCRAVNTLTGEFYESNLGRVFVTDSDRSEVTRLIYPEKNLTRIAATPSQNLSIACVGRGIPSPETIWYRELDGELVRVVPGPGVRIHLETMTLLQVSSQDAGVYVCKVTNSIFKEISRFEVEVKVALELRLTPSMQRVRKGTNFTLTCSHREKIDTVAWYRNGFELSQNSRTRFQAERSTLTVVNLEEEDGGIYQCFGTSHGHTAAAVARIIIQDSVPEIVSSFSAETFIPGQFMSLKCVGRGRPPPRFTWQLDGFSISEDDRYRHSQYVTAADDVESQLNLTHLTDRDGGHYSCRAENKAGSVIHTQHIRVFGPPYIREVDPVSGIEGEDLRVQCPVSGYPVQTITWKKDGDLIDDGEKTMIFHNGTILFKKASKAVTEGEYTCVASSQVSHYTRSITINIIVPPKMLGFSFQNSLLEEGMRTVVTCQTVQGELPIRFTWSRDGEEVKDTSTLSIQQATYSSTLFIKKLDRGHTGNYTCTATNTAGIDQRTAELTVNVPPEWIFEPEDVRITSGESLTVPCSAFGVPAPSSTWSKKDTSGSLSLVTRMENGLLEIPSVDSSWEGEYTCTVDNGVGRHLEKKINIDVKSPPTFKLRELERRVERGERILVECYAEGDARIEYQWSKDGTTISEAQFQRYRSSTENTISVLQIEKVILEDSGEFRCEAVNPYGRDMMMVSLVVLDVPGAPRNLSISDITSRQGLVSWIPPHSGNSPILHYTVHSRLYSVGAGVENVNEITVSGQSRSLILRSLVPGQEYSLTVRAHNALGPGNASEPIQFTTLEQAPTGRARVLSVSARSSTELELKWEAPPVSMWNSQQIGYTVGYRFEESSNDFHYLNLAMSKKKRFSLLLEGLEKYRRYEVVVDTWNYIGKGERTVSYFATTLQDVPSGGPENLICKAKSSTALSLSWEPPLLSNRNGEIIKFSYQYFNTKFPDEIRTGELEDTEVILDHLHIFSNYSFKIRAHTQIGAGPYSSHIYCSTLEDVPGAPAKVKVISTGDSSFYVSWLPPNQPSGIILRYTVYWRMQAEGAQIQTLKTRGTQVRLGPLQLSLWYDFWVRAETRVGQGPSSSISTILAQNTGNAQIVSFGKSWKVRHGSSLVLDCLSVGFPEVKQRWIREGVEVGPGRGIRILPNNSLVLSNLSRENQGEFHCEVDNKEGADRITHTVIVESPPLPPDLGVTRITHDSALFVWKVSAEKIPILAFTLSYRTLDQDWERVTVIPPAATFRLTGLSCGTSFLAFMFASNRIGEGANSSTLTFQTEGSAPSIEKTGSLLVRNQTSVLVLLDRFEEEGCPFINFVIEYRPDHSSEFVLVSNSVPGTSKEYRIHGLLPATRYVVRVAAVNSAGDIQVEEEVSTLGKDGKALNVYKSGSSGVRLVLIFLVVMGVPGLLTGLGLLAYFAFKRRVRSNPGGVVMMNKSNFNAKNYIGVTPHPPPPPPPPPGVLRYPSLQPQDVLYEEVCPYATVEVRKEPDLATLYHQEFVYGDKYKSLQAVPVRGPNLYSQINHMETFRLQDNQMQDENVYSKTFQSLEDDFPGYETEEETDDEDRDLQRRRSKRSRNSTSRSIRNLHQADFDPFDFPPKRKVKQKTGFRETKFT